MSARMAYERVRVVEALAELPLTQSTLAAGGITYSAVRELTRVMTSDSEAAWLAHVGGLSVRDIERQVVGLEPGAMPGDEPDPGSGEASPGAVQGVVCDDGRGARSDAGVLP